MSEEQRFDPEIQELIEHMDGSLDAAYHRLGMEAPKHNGRPMVMQMQQMLPPPGDEEQVIWLEAFRAFLDFLFTQGPRPDRVLRRLFAITWAVNPELLVGMSQTQVAELMKETRAAFQLRVKVVYSDYLRSKGYRGTSVPGQKSETARQTFAARAKGNKNRLKGRKKGDLRKAA